MTVHPTDQMSEVVVAPHCSITSGATAYSQLRESGETAIIRTPVWTSHNLVVPDRCCCSIAGDSKVGELDTAILIREDVGTLDVAVYDALLMQVHETFQYLRDVHAYEGFRELAKTLADVVQ